jgi:hypothetical protein
VQAKFKLKKAMQTIVNLYPVKNYNNCVNESGAKKRCKQKIVKAMQKRQLILIKKRQFYTADKVHIPH